MKDGCSSDADPTAGSHPCPLRSDCPASGSTNQHRSRPVSPAQRPDGVLAAAACETGVVRALAGGETGKYHHVVEVAASARVEGSAAGDEAELRVAGVRVHLTGRKARLRVLADRVNNEVGVAPVLPGHPDAVAGA